MDRSVVVNRIGDYLVYKSSSNDWDYISHGRCGGIMTRINISDTYDIFTCNHYNLRLPIPIYYKDWESVIRYFKTTKGERDGQGRYCLF